MCATQGCRARMGQQIQELRNIITLQEQDGKYSRQLAEEKLSKKSSLLSKLRGRVQEDVHALHIAQKHEQRVTSEVCGAHKNLLGKSVKEALEKMQRSIFYQVNTYNALLHEVRQRIRAWDALWQQLQDLTLAGKLHQEQLQRIRQLENSVEKMHVKIHAAQKVTASYLVLRDALKRELYSLPLHLELLHAVARAYHGEAQHRELVAADAVKARDMATAKKDLDRLEARYLAEEEELRQRCLAARKAQGNRLWFRQAEEKHLRAHSRSDLHADETSLLLEDSELGPLQASRSQLEHEAFVIAEVEKIKAALQCSRVQGITSRLLAQHESTAVLEQQLRACKEKRQALMDTLRALEVELARLKFCEPPGPISCRKLEAELRERLQQEEARLEQAQALYLRQKELLLLLENGIDNLIARLHSNAMPEQDLCVDFKGVDEKLQYCRQKLQHLAQRVGSLPAHCYSPDEDNKIFVKVRDLLEKRTAKESKLMTRSKDVDSGLQDPCHFPFEEDQGLVLSRDGIKKQGQRLIDRKKRSSKRKY